jgi:UDP-glucose 4-epimerase
MRSCVTGAAGFIGSTLVDRLLADGHQVVGIDNNRSTGVANLEHALRCNVLSPGQFTLVQADIQAPELTDIVAGSNLDVIFHLVAQVDLRASVSAPELDARSNVRGLRLVKSIRERRPVRGLLVGADAAIAGVVQEGEP